MSELSFSEHSQSTKSDSQDKRMNVKQKDDINCELKKAISERHRADHEIKNLEKKQAMQLGNYISQHFALDKTCDNDGNIHIKGIVFSVKIASGITKKYELIPAKFGNAYICTLNKNDARMVEDSNNQQDISNMLDSQVVLPVGTDKHLYSFPGRNEPIIHGVKVLHSQESDNKSKNSNDSSSQSQSSKVPLLRPDSNNDSVDNSDQSQSSSSNNSSSK